MHPTMKHLVAAALATARSQEEIKDANEHIAKAVQVVHRMGANPEMRALLQRSTRTKRPAITGARWRRAMS